MVYYLNLKRGIWMEEVLRSVFNMVFLKYRFLFKERKALKNLVNDITKKYRRKTTLDVDIASSYLMEIESLVRDYLRDKMSSNPYEVINDYINIELKGTTKWVMELDSISYLCEIGNYKINNVMIKRLLLDNEVLNKIVGEALKENMVYLKNGSLMKSVSNEVTREFIYTYCDLENIDIDLISPNSKYPYYGYALPPFNSSEEELKVVLKAQSGDKNATEELVLRNIKLINKRAIRYASGQISVDDLVEEGITGLLIAIKKFDSTCNTRFATYADYWVKDAMTRFIRTKENSVRLGSSDVTLYNNYMQFQDDYYLKNDSMPTLSEAALKLGVSVERLNKIISLRRSDIRLDDFVSFDDNETRAIDLIPDESIDIESDLEDLEVKRKLKIVLNSIALSYNEKVVIYYRFHFNGSPDEYPLKMIGDYLGVTAQRVKQIEESALNRIHNSRIFQELFMNAKKSKRTFVRK